MDTISNTLDEFRDLFEVYLGLHFAVVDLMDIRNELSSWQQQLDNQTL